MTVLRAPVLLLFALAAACGLGVSGTAAGPDASVDGGPVGPAGPPIEEHDASAADASGVDAAASPITHVGTVTGQSSNTVVVTVENIPSVGDFYVAAVATKPYVRVMQVVGGPSEWHLAAFQCGEADQTGIEVWSANRTTSTVSAIVNVGLEKAPANAVAAVSAYTGARAIGNIVSSNSNGFMGSCIEGGEGTNAFSLAVLPHPGALTYGAIAIRNRTLTPGAGNFELGKVGAGQGGDAAALVVLGSTTRIITGTLNGPTGWALIGGELLP